MNTRDQSNVEGVKDILQILQALNALYVRDIRDGVCAFMQIHTDTQCTAYMPLAPPRGRAPFKKPPILWI